MLTLIRYFILALFFFIISSGDYVQAHGYHHLHSLKELENHITSHVKQLEILLNQKFPNEIQIAEVREEILEHVQEYQELVKSIAMEEGLQNLTDALNQNSELLKETALNHDYHGSLVILKRVEMLLISHPVTLPNISPVVAW